MNILLSDYKKKFDQIIANIMEICPRINIFPFYTVSKFIFYMIDRKHRLYGYLFLKVQRKRKTMLR